MPRVWNKYDRNCPADAVNIMRGTPWGNPFVIGPDGDRLTVVAKHRAMLEADPVRAARLAEVLRGKDLKCCCAPRACHGDTWLEWANR